MMETCGDGPIELRSLLPEQLAELMQQMGEPAFRAKQIFSWCAKGAASIDEMNNLPKALRERLKQRCLLTAPVILRRQQSKKDGTIKYLFGLHDGNAVESVLMRYEHGTSLCISSQVGCRMGCSFCASTIGGLVRNLSPGELLDQLLRLLLGQDGAGVHRIHQQFQLRQLKGAPGQKVAAIPAGVGTEDVHAVFLKGFQVVVDGLSLRLHPHLGQLLAHLADGQRVLLVGLLPKEFGQKKQPPLPGVFSHPASRPFLNLICLLL